MKEAEILYRNGPFWVRAESYGTGRLRPKSNGFSVYKDGLTHATRVATFGYEGQIGLDRAKAEADRRATQKG